jgi:hypothetical protein
MRFSIASLAFICSGFIFFVLWAVSSFVLTEFYDAMSPTAASEAIGIMELVGTAFGIICAIFFVTGILLIFVLDSLADEPEMYWRR